MAPIPSRREIAILQWTLVLFGIILMSGLVVVRYAGVLDSNVLMLVGLVTGIALIFAGLCVGLSTENSKMPKNERP